MWTHTKTSQEKVTPEIALSYLKEGNQRFVKNLKLHRDLLQQVNQTSEGQFPFATILSCMDSRTSAEIIFDQGLGDIFSIRVAGHVLNDDVIGSMEYACKIANSKLIVVLGHTKCAAVINACNNFSLGSFTGLLSKLKPAILAETFTTSERNGDNIQFVNNVIVQNINLTIRLIRENSSIIRILEEENQLKIIGGLYSVETGEVSFDV